MEIDPIDCHPCYRSYDPIPFTRQERILLERALTKATSVAVTIPEPPCASWGLWLRELAKDTPKPGWIWLDGEVTVSDLLVGYGLRSSTPPFPLESNGFAAVLTDRIEEPRSIRPTERPQTGLTLGISQPVRCENPIDGWTIRTTCGDELEIWLIDCYSDLSKLQAAYDAAWDAMTKAKQLAVTIPRPMNGPEDWVGSLKANSRHSGWIWLDETLTLNEFLVREELCKEMPF